VVEALQNRSLRGLGLLTRVLLLLSLEPCELLDPRLAAASTAAAAAAVTAALVLLLLLLLLLILLLLLGELRWLRVGGFECDLFEDFEELAELMAELEDEASEARGMCQ